MRQTVVEWFQENKDNSSQWYSWDNTYNREHCYCSIRINAANLEQFFLSLNPETNRRKCVAAPNKKIKIHCIFYFQALFIIIICD